MDSGHCTAKVENLFPTSLCDLLTRRDLLLLSWLDRSLAVLGVSWSLKLQVSGWIILKTKFNFSVQSCVFSRQNCPKWAASKIQLLLKCILPRGACDLLISAIGTPAYKSRKPLLKLAVPLEKEKWVNTISILSVDTELCISLPVKWLCFLPLPFFLSYGRVYTADPYHALAPAASYGVGAVVSMISVSSKALIFCQEGFPYSIVCG